MHVVNSALVLQISIWVKMNKKGNSENAEKNTGMGIAFHSGADGEVVVS